jgi:hypothetical protein
MIRKCWALNIWCNMMQCKGLQLLYYNIIWVHTPIPCLARHNVDPSERYWPLGPPKKSDEGGCAWSNVGTPKSYGLYIKVYQCLSEFIIVPQPPLEWLYIYIPIYIYIYIIILYYNIISWALLGCVLCFEPNTKKAKIKGNKAWEINWGHRTFWHIMAYRT